MSKTFGHLGPVPRNSDVISLGSGLSTGVLKFPQVMFTWIRITFDISEGFFNLIA